MFRDSKQLTLENLEDGTIYPLTVRPLTMGMKSNLDEWLRVSYMNMARESENFNESVAEKTAETLDCMSCNWPLTWDKLGPRILFEMSKPNISYRDFIKQFFDLSIREIAQNATEQNECVARFNRNREVIQKAFEFGCQNPTDTPVADVQG